MIWIECSAFLAATNRKILTGSRFPWRRRPPLFLGFRAPRSRSAARGEDDAAPHARRSSSPPQRPSSTCNWCAQLRNDCGETPSSAAICGTGLPLLRSSATASRRKSNEYRPAMNTILSQSANAPSAQVSTKPGKTTRGCARRWAWSGATIPQSSAQSPIGASISAPCGPRFAPSASATGRGAGHR